MTAAAKRIVWDNHGCMPLRAGDERFLPQLERYRQAGVNVIGLNIGFGPQSADEHLRVSAWFRAWIGRRPDRYRLVGSVADIEAAVAGGRLGVFFDVEGMAPLEDDLGLVQRFYDEGVRWMLVAYNRNNAVGGGCYDDDGGLTAFGRTVLAEMRRVGMVVCCSHTGERTALEVCDHAGAPVILSHSNAKAVWEHARNVSDRLATACAATGGVIGVNGIGVFLGDNDNSTEAVVRHVDHLVQLVGPEHVGLGLDYVFDAQELREYLAKMRDTFPDDPSYARDIAMVEPERLPMIADRLGRLGYADQAVSAILGGNWLRVAHQVWI